MLNFAFINSNEQSKTEVAGMIEMEMNFLIAFYAKYCKSGHQPDKIVCILGM